MAVDLELTWPDRRSIPCQRLASVQTMKVGAIDHLTTEFANQI